MSAGVFVLLYLPFWDLTIHAPPFSCGDQHQLVVVDFERERERELN
jgi:hypothetical protein